MSIHKEAQGSPLRTTCLKCEFWTPNQPEFIAILDKRRVYRCQRNAYQFSRHNETCYNAEQKQEGKTP